MTTLTFKTLHRSESDEWSTLGEKITEPEKLELVRNTLETSGPILVEHWFFYGSRCPDRIVIEDFDSFIEYLQEQTHAGDAIHIWDLHPLLTEKTELLHGKCPAEDGAVPKKGAY